MMTFPSAARLSSASRSDAGIVFGVTHAIHIVLKLLKFAADEHVNLQELCQRIKQFMSPPAGTG